MRIRQWLAVTGAALLGASPYLVAARANAAEVADGRDGFVGVASRHLDAFRVQPGADFRGYTKVLLEPAQVALRDDWIRDMNRSTRELSQRVTAEDADSVAADARARLGDVLARTFKAAGYEIAAAPGAGVLRVAPQVVDMYVNAPDRVTTAPQNRVYTVDAGTATLVLELRDSVTGALLARATDRGTASISDSMRISRTSSVSSRGEFEDLFREWANAAVTAIDAAKSQPPVAMTGQPAKP
jgi:hypothetical protein